jgi:hypothetical protein
MDVTPMRLEMLKVPSLCNVFGGSNFNFVVARFRIAGVIAVKAVRAQTLRFKHAWPLNVRDLHAVSSKVIRKRAKLRASDADVQTGRGSYQRISKSVYWAAA